VSAVLFLITASLMIADPVRADPVSFNFAYVDAVGQGFNDPTSGPAAQTALDEAGYIWGSYLNSSYPGETIDVIATWYNTVPGGIAIGHPRIAALTSNILFPNVVPQTTYTIPLLEHLVGGDLDLQPLPARPSSFQDITYISPAIPSGYEGSITFIGTPSQYYLGLDGQPPGDRGDFLTLALHEIGHLLGFDSSLLSDGSFQNHPTIYNLYNTDAFGNPLVDLSPAERLAAATSGNRLFYAGPNGVAAHGGLPFNLSAPFVFTPGVSVTHISETYGDLGKDLMSPIMPPGEADDPSAVDLGVLADLGWDVQLSVPVPEPSTISLMMAGFLAFGFMTLRRRQTSSI